MQYFCRHCVYFGYFCGATRADELAKVVLSDMKEHEDLSFIKIPETKTHINRSFRIENEYGINDFCLEIHEPTPKKSRNGSSFLNFKNEKRKVQPIKEIKF